MAATLRDGREQLGFGYLVSGRLVPTAEHCTRDKATGEAAARLRVVRASDGAMADVAGVVPDRGLDVPCCSSLTARRGMPALRRCRSPELSRVKDGVLEDCTGIGFALFQRDPHRRTRHTSEFHGTITRRISGSTGGC